MPPTCGIHELAVEAEGEQGLSQVPEEVFEQAGDGVDVVHLAEQWHALATQELLLQLPHRALGPGQAVQPGLQQKGQRISQMCK